MPQRSRWPQTPQKTSWGETFAAHFGQLSLPVAGRVGGVGAGFGDGPGAGPDVGAEDESGLGESSGGVLSGDDDVGSGDGAGADGDGVGIDGGCWNSEGCEDGTTRGVVAVGGGAVGVGEVTGGAVADDRVEICVLADGEAAGIAVVRRDGAACAAPATSLSTGTAGTAWSASAVTSVSPHVGSMRPSGTTVTGGSVAATASAASSAAALAPCTGAGSA